MSTGDPVPVKDRSILGGTNVIIAEIYERGGRISKDDLLALVRSHAYDGRVVGIMHGRRLAHLRRDAGTGESVLTSRGEEVARQFLFAKRLSRREPSTMPICPICNSTGAEKVSVSGDEFEIQCPIDQRYRISVPDFEFGVSELTAADRSELGAWIAEQHRTGVFAPDVSSMPLLSRP
jgi:hypothetical protein